jgi:uncharacterized membrane protein YidH (DUF202 family)
MVGLDVQLLVGVFLSIFSPIIATAVNNFQGAMGTEQIRFIVAEHIPLMLVSVALAHIGSARARRIEEDSRRHREAALWFTLSLVLIIIAIPWWRPLLRGIT